MLGDFNELLNPGEKSGGKSSDRRRFLNEFIQSVEAFDLGFVGNGSLGRIGRPEMRTLRKCWIGSWPIKTD